MGRVRRAGKRKTVARRTREAGHSEGIHLPPVHGRPIPPTLHSCEFFPPRTRTWFHSIILFWIQFFLPVRMVSLAPGAICFTPPWFVLSCLVLSCLVLSDFDLIRPGCKNPTCTHPSKLTPPNRGTARCTLHTPHCCQKY